MCMACYQVDCNKNIGFQASLEASRHTGERIYPHDLGIMVNFLESFSKTSGSWGYDTVVDIGKEVQKAQTEPEWTWGVEVEKAPMPPTSIPWTWGASSTEAQWTWGTKTSWLGMCSFCHAEKEARYYD